MAGGMRLVPGAMARIEIAGAAMLDRITDRILDDMKAGAPVDTGELVASIRKESPSPTKRRLWVGTDHWAPTEFGSGPHYIVSHGAYPLRNSETGQVFGQMVWHPGTPAQPFMRPALYKRRTL